MDVAPTEDGTNKPVDRRWIWGVALFVFLWQVPGLWAARDWMLWNVDESVLAMAVVDRWLGVPSTTLAWPTGPHLLLGQLYVVGSFFGSGESLGLEGFMRHLNGLLGDFGGLLVFLRLIGIGLSVWAAAALTGAVLKRGVAGWVAGPAIVAFFGLPVVARYDAMAKGDGPGFCLAILALVCALDEERPRPVWLGVLIGTMLAFRVTLVPVAVLVAVVAMVVYRGSVRPGRTLGHGLVAAVGSFLLFCPFLWTDPTRFFKATLGQLARGDGESVGFAKASTALAQMADPLFGVLLLGVLVFGLMSKRWWAVGGGLGVAAIYVLLTARSGIYFDRYLLAAFLVFPVALITGAERLSGFGTWGVRVAAGVGVLAILWNSSNWLDETETTRIRSGLLRSGLSAAIDGADGGVVLVPPGLLTQAPVGREVSRESAGRLWRGVATGYVSSDQVAYGQDVMNPLRDAVAERERRLIAQFRLAEAFSDGTADFGFWERDDTAERYGAVPESELFAELLSGRVGSVFGPRYERVSVGVKVVGVYGPLAVYVRE